MSINLWQVCMYILYSYESISCVVIVLFLAGLKLLGGMHLEKQASRLLRY